MNKSLLDDSIMQCSINNRNDERESCFDAFSTCETCFREEMSLANQAFNDLARLPSDLDLCEPLHQDERHTQNANTQFCQILEALDIGDATELADALSIDIGICKRVYNNPLLCNGKERALILHELDNSSSPFLELMRKTANSTSTANRAAIQLDTCIVRVSKNWFVVVGTCQK